MYKDSLIFSSIFCVFSVTRHSRIEEFTLEFEEFTDETLAINDTYEDDVREIVVLVMEVDKVADEVTDVEIDK